MTLSCPSCGLVLALRGPQAEYCPRCIAKRRQPVPLIAESLNRRPGDRHAADAADPAAEGMRRSGLPG